MRRSDIKIGTRYRCKEYGVRRCVEVSGEPLPHLYKSGGYIQFPVIYPYSLDDDGSPRTGRLDPADFSREWNEEDQQKMDADIQDSQDSEAAKHLFEEMGFDTVSVSITNGGNRITMMVIGNEAVNKLIDYISVAKKLMEEEKDV